jgi:predicted nuclease of restriction endonuclease-like RecB superfamily
MRATVGDVLVAGRRTTTVLTKDLLRVSRAGGGYHPQFTERSDRPLAARVLGTFADHVGRPRTALEDTLTDLEADADDFKLVRGFASLCERDAAFETRAEIPPDRARRVAFEEGAAVAVVDEDDRNRALARAADRLGVSTDAVAASLYADRESRQVLAAFEPRWSPDELLAQYDLSLAQTALFDATAVRIRSSDPAGLISAVKRLRLMYKVCPTDDGREVVVTGPDHLFRRTRRYGTAFARVLRSVAAAPDWRLVATIDDRGTERELELTDDDVRVPGVDPVTEPTYDSGVEADFAARFAALDLDWDLVREPEPLAVNERVMIPDFAFDYRYADFRVFFEIMGFWTPSYVEKKLGQLADVEEVEMLVAVDRTLGVSEDVEARDHRAITYDGSVRIKDVVDALREYESSLVATSRAALPDELRPDADVASLSSVASTHGVSEDALDTVAFPDHERVGRTLVRPAVLDAAGSDLEPGMSLQAATTLLADRGLSETSAALSRLGFEIEWEGLSGGTLRRTD